MSFPNSFIVEINTIDAEALLRHLRQDRSLSDWPDAVARLYCQLDREVTEALRGRAARAVENSKR